MTNLSSDIITQFNAGSTAAFEKIYNYYYRQLYFFARRLVNDTMEAEDIVAECFVKIWNKREDFRTLQNVKAFLFIATRNACFNALRAAQTQSATRKEISYLFSEEEYILQEEITAELMQLLYSDIETLPPKRRKIVKMILEGLTDSQIAERLNITSKTVRNQRANAIQLLREAFLNRATYCITGLLAILYSFIK